MGDFYINTLHNNIYGRQDADTIDITSNALSIASVSAE